MGDMTRERGSKAVSMPGGKVEQVAGSLASGEGHLTWHGGCYALHFSISKRAKVCENTGKHRGALN
jgi:hypothetical protein